MGVHYAEFNVFKAHNAPVVTPSVYDVDLSLSTEIGDVIHQFRARDDDVEACHHKDQTCTCAIPRWDQ